MGWFTSKKRGHVVRNEAGTMVAKITVSMLDAMLDEFGDSIKVNVHRTRYIYSGEGFSAGTSEMLKVYIWDGYTIDCSTTDM